MPVTECAHLTLLDPKPTPQDFILAFQQVLAIQDNWYKTNADPTRNTTASPPSSSSSSSSFSSSSPAAAPKTFCHQAGNRGAAFFQQVQDPKQILITAHWASVDEHKAWIASDDNKRAMGQVSPFIDLHRTVLFHVSDASLFPRDILEQSSAAETISSSTAVAGGQGRDSKEGVSNTPADITLIRYFAAEKDKEIFEAHVTQGLEASQGRGGWRIEKDSCQSENILEYVVVAARCGKRGGADGADGADGDDDDDAEEKNNNVGLVDKFFLGSEARQYRRLC